MPSRNRHEIEDLLIERDQVRALRTHVERAWLAAADFAFCAGGTLIDASNILAERCDALADLDGILTRELDYEGVREP